MTARLRVARVDYAAHLGCLVGHHDADGALTHIVRPVTFVPYDQGEMVEPSFKLPLEAGQELIDQLWRDGFRPTRNSIGEDLAVSHMSHIQDLRQSHEALIEIALRKK